MVIINGKEYEVNLDIKWGTQKLMRRIQADPDNPKNMQYTEYILKDLLVPSPTNKEMMEFRNSDLENVFNEFADNVEAKDKDFKKKRSR